jgi:hypothetical protein
MTHDSPTQPEILQNARVKGASKKKGVSKVRKARPVKNIEVSVLNARFQETQKHVLSAECKMTLLKETSYLPQAYRLSILIDKQALFG